MHALVSTLRTAVPPYSDPIDLDHRDWLREGLTKVLVEMGQIERQCPRVDPTEFALYRRIIDSVVMVVINYWSVEIPGRVGDRHTATWINPRNFRTYSVKKTRELGDITEQNYLVMPEVHYSHERRKQNAVERIWFDRWRRYHTPPPPVRFTLNSALLCSVRPAPAFISWFPEEAKPTKIFTPLSLNSSRGVMRRWATEPGLVGPPSPELDHFIHAFRAMFDADQHEYHDPAAGAAMIGWLVQLFGDLGGQCFFSIPAQVRVHSGKRGGAVDRDLQAVLSISLKHPWDTELYEAAWQFFLGIANQVLRDIMTSEYVAYAHARWERNKSNAVYLTSHPLGRRLNSIKILSGELAKELVKPLQPDRVAIVAEKALRLDRRAGAAVGFVNYINLLSDMLAESTVNEVQDSRTLNRTQPQRPGPHWIDLRGLIQRAASKAVDKGTGLRSIELIGRLDTAMLVSRRLCSGKLRRHQDKEEELIELIFSELFENAANSGALPSGARVGAVPVRIEVVTGVAESFVIVMENLVHSSFLNKAAQDARRLHAKDEDRRLASGLTLAEELLSQLQLGEVDSHLQRAMPFRWPSLSGEPHVWRTEIRISQG